MKRTNKYQLGYFEEGDLTSSVVEMQRWETLDAQLYALFDILGNGVIEGWGLLPSSGLSIVIAPGAGHVNFVSVESTENESLTGLLPNSRNYIYASLIDDSYWTKDVSFSALSSQSQLGIEDYLFLGYADTDDDSVTSVNTDGRTSLGFITLIQSLVASHRHIGGTDNPPPVNLSSEVQGILNQENLPLLDASIIQTGTIDDDRLPTIDHITKLINQGTLTHAQLDSFTETLSLENPMLMGETSTIDLLQLILALKHVYPDVDEFLVNEIAYIPGISPDEYVDWDNTTATVDVLSYADGGTHTITGAASTGKNAYTKTWDTEEEFDAGTTSDVVVDGGSVCLETQEVTRLIDEFNDITTWEVITDDLSSLSIALSKDTSAYVVPPSSGKLVVGDSTVEIALVIRKEFDAQDWSQFDYIVFYLKTESVQHGDILFFINDAIAGTQNSHTKIVDRNAPTINVDTLQNGWQQVIVNISAYTRTNIDTIGFYVSSQKGWDTSKGFDLNIDNIYLTSGNKYKDDGYLREIFGNADFPYEYWRVRWDASIPTDAQSSGLEFKTRTRVGNTLPDLATAAWSAYSSLAIAEITLPVGVLYNYIEVEVFFGASTDLTRSACLTKLYLDFYAADTDGSFNYNDQDDWESGNIFNIDLITVPDSMVLAKTEEVNDIFYGAGGKIVQLDDDLVEIYNITGTMLPRSTYQILNGLPPAFGLITGISRGNDGNVWACDTDNDRVIEVDKGGVLLRGFFGSYLVENVLSTETTTTTTTQSIQNLSLLQVLYNFEKGFLYLIFNQDVNEVGFEGITEKHIRIGSNTFYLDQYTPTVALQGFDNVLRIQVLGADATLLKNLLYPQEPSIVTLQPFANQVLTSTSTVFKFLVYNFVLGSEDGENGIRVTIDGSIVRDVYGDTTTFTTLSAGSHTFKSQLLNADGTLNTNIEAVSEGMFIVSDVLLAEPCICIQSPKSNQIYSESPVSIDFAVNNFAVLPTGQHVRYVVDSGPPVDYYSEENILVEDLEAGSHTVRLYLVDKRGDDLGYQYGSATVEFIVGLNSNALTKFYAKVNQVPINSDVLVYNLIFSDVYAPFDVQFIPPEPSTINPSGEESVLIGKLTNNYIMSKLES